ncbi:hypothetical protein [Thiohalospira halophila]|uniref:hypothetical protein n=1 Tax=Thiohalospira halophila TaxID=381300 RepID=UPI00117CD935|nr:hypothetical protein [Thiohalospira halophila]
MAYNEIGIERGIRKVDRLKAGEPDSKTVHRSVKQLHADLPAEIEAAQEHTQEVLAEAREQADVARTEAADAEAERERARERADEAQAELQALEEKIAKNERLESRAREQAEKAEAEGGERAARARKKERTYQKRAEKARARYDEIMAEPPLPEPRREKIVTQDRGAFRQPETKLVRVYPARQIEQYTAHTDMLRKKTEDNNRALRKRLKTLEDATNKWPHAGPDTEVSWSAEKALTARQEHRYGVICSTQDNEIAVPPQNATPKQVAAAIYRHGKEQGWPSLVLDADTNVQREVLRVAKEDGRLEWVQGVRAEIRKDFDPIPATTGEPAVANTQRPIQHEDLEPPTAPTSP